jgi:transposase-like protein
MPIQVSLKLEISATASLTDLEQGIQEARQQAMREALKQAIRQREDQQVACPYCGHTQRRLEGTIGRVVATVFGRVSLPRRRFRCQDCWRRWCPANRLFVGLAGTTISQPLQDAARLAGSSWPYRVASHLLQKLSGAHISAEEIRLLTNAHGKRRAVEQQSEAEHLCLTSSKPATPPGKRKATDPGGVGWGMGRKPGATRRHGRQSRGGLFPGARLAHA